METGQAGGRKASISAVDNQTNSKAQRAEREVKGYTSSFVFAQDDTQLRVILRPSSFVFPDEAGQAAKGDTSHFDYAQCDKLSMTEKKYGKQKRKKNENKKINFIIILHAYSIKF